MVQVAQQVGLGEQHVHVSGVHFNYNVYGQSESQSLIGFSKTD